MHIYCARVSLLNDTGILLRSKGRVVGCFLFASLGFFLGFADRPVTIDIDRHVRSFLDIALGRIAIKQGAFFVFPHGTRRRAAAGPTGVRIGRFVNPATRLKLKALAERRLVARVESVSFRLTEKSSRPMARSSSAPSQPHRGWFHAAANFARSIERSLSWVTKLRPAKSNCKIC